MSRSFRTGTLSTFNDVECEATKGSFLVSRLHVEPSLVRRLDDLGERDFVFAALLDRHTTCVDGFHGAHGIALDARNLDQSTDGSHVIPKLCSMPISAAYSKWRLFPPNASANHHHAIEHSYPPSPHHPPSTSPSST